MNMSKVGKNTVASVATIMCMVFVLSIVLPLSGAQSVDPKPVTHVTVAGTFNDQTGWYIYNASGTWVTLTAVYNGSGTGHTYYKINNTGASYTTYTSSFALPDGNHTLYYYSVDNAGYTEGTKSTVIKVDSRPPVVNFTINGNKNATTGYYNGTNTVNLTASDNCSGVFNISYSFDNNIWTNYTSNITNLPDGQITLYYRSYDVAGNVNLTSTLINVFNPAIDVSPASQWYTGDVYVTFNYDYPGSIDHIDYTYDKKTWYQSFTHGSPSIYLSMEGNTSIYYRAVGANGISDLRFMWYGLDKYPPTIGISIDGDKSSSGWYNGDITVHINANDNGSISHTEWSWDNSSWNNYGGPFKVSRQSSKTIYYRTFDMFNRTASGSTWIYFAPGSYDQGSMSNSVWINGVLYGPSSGTSPSGSETPISTPTPTYVFKPTPELVPSPTPATETTTGSNSPLALAVLIGVLAIVAVAAAGAYFFVLKPK